MANDLIKCDLTRKLRKFAESFHPSIPLPAPICDRGDWAQSSFRKRARPLNSHLKYSFLDVWREIDQIHDLRQSSARHLTKPRQLRLIRHNAFARALIRQAGLYSGLSSDVYLMRNQAVRQRLSDLRVRRQSHTSHYGQRRNERPND